MKSQDMKLVVTNWLGMAAFSVVTLVYAKSAQAAITVSNLTLSPTSVSFDISGTFPTPTVGSQGALFFANPTFNASPGFALGDFDYVISMSFSGSQSLFGIYTGNANVGDYFVVEFLDDLTDGESISGTLTASWGITAFDPSQVTSLEVRWGTDGFALGSVIATASVVPEPTSFVLLEVAALGLILARRRRLAA